MNSLPINPKCCFCDNFYINHSLKIRMWSFPSENENISFFQWNRHCRICTQVKQKQSHKCLQCFSSKHDCVGDHGFFLAKMDIDLLPRFISMLDEQEKYFFAFSSKEALKLVDIKQKLIVAEKMQLDNLDYYIPIFDESIILVTEKFEAFYLDQKSNVEKIIYNNLFISLASKTLIVKAKLIELRNLQISSNHLELLLSTRTVEIKLFKVEITPWTKLSNILKNLPNVEKIIMRYTNIYFDNLWTEELQHCKALKKFILPFESLNIKRENLRGVIKNWSKHQIKIVLDLKNIEKEFYQILTKLKLMENILLF